MFQLPCHIAHSQALLGPSWLSQPRSRSRSPLCSAPTPDHDLWGGMAQAPSVSRDNKNLHDFPRVRWWTEIKKNEKYQFFLTMSGHVDFESLPDQLINNKTSVLIFSMLGRLEFENRCWSIHRLTLILKTMDPHIFTHMLDLKLRPMNSKEVMFAWNWKLWIQWDLVTK